MKYLLSNGNVTSDRITYVKDLIKLNLLIRLDEIPYWKGGSSEIITSIINSDLESELTHIINQVIDKVKVQISNITINLSNITISGSSVNISIKINDTIETYVITRND